MLSFSLIEVNTNLFVCRIASSRYGKSSARSLSSIGNTSRQQGIVGTRSVTLGSARSATLESVRSTADLSIQGDTSEMVKLAEQIVGDDQSLTGEINR